MRLTNDRNELIRLREHSRNVGVMSIALLTLRDGTTIEGALRHVDVGSKPHEGVTHWYGGIKIQPLEGDHVIEVDLLDVQHAENVWDSRKDAYVKAGHVVIVDLPRSKE